MQVKLLKTGSYAFHGAWGPVVNFSIGDIYEGSKIYCRKLIADGWGEQIGESDDQQVQDHLETIKNVDDLKNLVSTMPDDDNFKKTVIQRWGLKRFAVKVKKVKSIENMLSELCELEGSE